MRSFPKSSFAFVAICIVATPAIAGGGVSLNPMQTTMQFTPHTPEVVPANHPLFMKVMVDPIVDVPDKIGTFMNAFARAKEINEALSKGMTDAGMRSPDANAGPFRLTATWLSFDSPFRISASSRAAVTIRYELRRVNSGAVIFQRDISTSAESSGGNAADRQRGTVRATLAANFAGAIWCIEQAAYGKAPDNCAVSPVGSFAAPIVVPIFR
jgi:hypothetical protein